MQYNTWLNVHQLKRIIHIYIGKTKEKVIIEKKPHDFFTDNFLQSHTGKITVCK